MCVYAGVSVYTQQKERTINILHKCRNKRLRQDVIHTHIQTEQTLTQQRHAQSCTCSWVFWTRVISGPLCCKSLYRIRSHCKYLECCQCCKMLRNPPFAIQRSEQSCPHPMCMPQQQIVNFFHTIICSIGSWTHPPPHPTTCKLSKIKVSCYLSYWPAAAYHTQTEQKIDHSLQLFSNFL